MCVSEILRFIDRLRKKKQKRPAPEVIMPEADEPKKDAPLPAEKPIQTEPDEPDFEHWRVRIRRMMNFSLEQMPRQIPQEGTEGGYGFRIDLRGTQNRATLMVECKDSVLRNLTIRVTRTGSDLCAMHYIKTGTRDELVAYLADEANEEELFESICQLSAKVDEYHE